MKKTSGSGNLFIEAQAEASMTLMKMTEPPEGFILAFSGGKDSIVLYDLAKRSGVKFEARYRITSCDPPELLKFIRNAYPDVIMDRPAETMWSLIVKKKMPPTRLVRYCCEELKETANPGRITLTGVRWAESPRRRKSWKQFNHCQRTGRIVINPILTWTDSEIWEYILTRPLQYCSLYDEGFDRLGCIGCPMARPKKRIKEFERWPKYKAAYLHAFTRMIEARKAAGLKTDNWKTAEDVFSWWIER